MFIKYKFCKWLTTRYNTRNGQEIKQFKIIINKVQQNK